MNVCLIKGPTFEAPKSLSYFGSVPSLGLAFCRIVQARTMAFSWQLPSGTRSEVVDQEVARPLYDSGCRNFGYAPESGSPRILKAIKKQDQFLSTKLKQIRQRVRSS